MNPEPVLLTMLRPVLLEKALTVRQLATLLRLMGAPPTDFRALRRDLGVSGGAMCRVLDKLEILGYAERCRNDKDRRRVFVALTDEGIGFVKRIAA